MRQDTVLPDNPANLKLPYSKLVSQLTMFDKENVEEFPQNFFSRFVLAEGSAH